jgi:2-iminobutanoate/2-iminopropanoate deaminase
MARSIHVSEAAHKNPVPSASIVGNLLASGLITGRDPATGEFPPSMDAQCAFMFAGIRAILESAGGQVADIIRITIWLEDRREREAINKAWVSMFPDPGARPARLTLNRPLDQGKLIECEILAVLRG